jgi:hypothetical protein
VRLEPLYRVTFRYAESWQTSAEFLGIAEGRVEGRLAGRFRGANRARRLPDGTFVPDLNGAIATEDGAAVLVRFTGYGRPDAEPSGRVVAAVTHATDDEAYSWLDGVLGAVAGEVRGGREIVLDVAELVWEPLGEVAPDRGA